VPTTPPAPDFTIGATPPAQSVSPGGSTTYSVTVGAVSGFDGTVNLSVSGLPANASANWSSNTVTATGNVTLTVTTTASTPVGTATLTITGTSGALTHS